MLKLIQLAWPLVLGSLGTMAMGVVDIIMVGQLGGEPLAAVSLGRTWSFTGIIFIIGVAMGVDPDVTQAYGRDRPRDAGAAVLNGVGVLMGVGGLVWLWHLLAGPGLRALGEPVELIADARAYAWVVSLSIPTFIAFSLLKQLLQGSGQMRPVMWVMVFANLVNILVNWLLIFGNLGFPALGVVGSAWATVFSRGVMAAGLLALGWGSVRAAWPGWAVVTVPRVLRLAGIALPVGLQVGLEGWAFIASTLMAGWVGSTALAAHTVALTVCSTAFMVPLGIAGAAATRVGNHIGAGEPWERSGWQAIGLGATVMTGSALLLATLPVQLSDLFTDEAAVVMLAATLLPIAAAFQLFDGTQVVAFGVLRGCADTRVPALANVLGYWVLGIPASYVMAFWLGHGIHGIWYGLTLGLAVTAILLLIRVASTPPEGRPTAA